MKDNRIWTRTVVAGMALMLTTMSSADVTFGFKRALTVTGSEGTSGMVGDVVIENSHKAITLTWIEKSNDKISRSTGVKSFSYNNVDYQTSGGEQDLHYIMQKTFGLEADDNYFGYEVTVAKGYNLTLNKVDVDYILTAKGLGYDVGVVNMATPTDTIRLGKVEQRKVENVELHAAINNCVLKGGNTYRLVLRHYQWYTNGTAEHIPLTFQFTGSLESQDAVAPKLQTLTIDGVSVIDKLNGGSIDYKLPYGVTRFPAIEAAVNDECRLEIVQPTLATKYALVRMFDSNDNAVDSVRINIVPGSPASSSEKIAVADPVISIAEGDAADTVTLTSETDNAHIYYTFDESDPMKNGTEYTGPFTLAGNCTLRVYAALPEYNLNPSDEAQEKINHFSKDIDPDHPHSFQMPAFPGAEGGGRYVTGGRGGKVYHVTNLDDSGTGSLRWAISQSGPRTIVFDVAGTIELKSDLKVTNGDVTIAGQTAPGEGICLRNYSLFIGCNNVIVRYIRSRLGESSGAETDASWSRDQKNIILDHCSFSWSVDETASYYCMTNFTMQWCYVNESLANATHVKGAHGYGGLWGGWNTSYHHNMLAHHYSRTPRWVVYPDGSVDFRNNVTYNWGPVLGCYGAQGGKYNIVNNYYKPGAATNQKPSIAGRIVSCGVVDDTTLEVGQFYLSGNRFDYSSPYLGSTAISNAKATDKDNTKGLHHDSRVALSKHLSKTEHHFAATTSHTAEIGYEKVLQFGGCCLRRDAIDERVANDVRTGGYTYANGAKAASNGSGGGLIDAPEDVGGYVAYTCTDEEKAAKKDSDGDGIPDAWEVAMGLNPDDASDALAIHEESGYSWFEYYLSTLVASITKACTSVESTGIEMIADTKNVGNAEWKLGIDGVSLKGAAALRAYDLKGTCRDYSPCDCLSFSRLYPGVYVIVADMADGRTLGKKVNVR